MPQNKQWMNKWMTEWAHSSRPWVRDASLEGHPLKVGSLSVREGPVEDGEDVGHVVHAHRRAFEHGAEGMRWDAYFNRKSLHSQLRDPPNLSILQFI